MIANALMGCLCCWNHVLHTIASRIEDDVMHYKLPSTCIRPRRQCMSRETDRYDDCKSAGPAEDVCRNKMHPNVPGGQLGGGPARWGVLAMRPQLTKQLGLCAGCMLPAGEAALVSASMGPILNVGRLLPSSAVDRGWPAGRTLIPNHIDRLSHGGQAWDGLHARSLIPNRH